MYKADPRLMHDLDDIRRFPLSDEDLIVAGFPKSGTNWMQIMFANLWDHWSTTRNPNKRVPNLSGPAYDNYEGYDSCIACDPPRLMKTHLPRAHMPERWPAHGKVVHITRNPKDVCISYFYELSHLSRTVPDSPQAVADFSVHVEQFARGEVLYGPYLENVLSWREFDHPNLLKVTYEDARADIRAVLERVIEFVDLPVQANRLDEVIAETDFDAMRSSDLRKQINVPNQREDTPTPFMRKGMVGDWMNGLSVAQNERLEQEIVRPLEERGVFLKYE